MQPATTIPAITLYQPWASLIAIGAKQYETRHWQTKYRGPIAIHAGAHLQTARLARLGVLSTTTILRALDLEAWARGLGSWPNMLREFQATCAELPAGAVVCIGTLSGMYPTDSVSLKVGSVERTFGNFNPHRWAWQISGVVPLASPVAARGFPGLWNWEYPPSLLDTPAGEIIRRDLAVRR